MIQHISSSTQPSQLRLLVTIANHGDKQRHFLEQLLASYRSMPYEVSVVILSDKEKDFGPDVEVRVGAPSPNPWSLPFAHRQVFQDRLRDYDYFIYSEDDTLVTAEHIEAFVRGCEMLGKNEIPGFIRSETDSEGNLHYSGCHSHFRWIPSSVCERGGKLWAELSNQHSACYIASRQHLEQAFASGGFPLEPHEGQYDMLCTAATDLYVSCGFKRLVCIDDLPAYTLPHLPNKYIGILGTPQEELDWQIEALRKIHAGKLPAEEISFPETKLPGGMASKHYWEQPDPKLEELIGRPSLRILIWGSGNGRLGLGLRQAGHRVSVVPLDPVMGECCKKRGLSFHESGEQYDVLVVADALHVVKDPTRQLERLRPLIRRGGRLIARVPNLNSINLRRKRYTDPRFKRPWTRDHIGAIPYNARKFRALAKENGFTHVEIDTPVAEKWETVDRLSLGAFSGIFSRYLYLSCQPDSDTCADPTFQSSSQPTTAKASSALA